MSADSKISIVFTDSGLGGLSVMVMFYKGLLERLSYIKADKIELVFFNALPENGQGYNRMGSMQLKVDTFNRALQEMESLYNPDAIAIACNTLSAVYPLTPFALKSRETFEIISSGRYLINQQRRKEPEIPVFAIATPTTVWSGAYEMNDPQVMQVSGANLASQIEMDHNGKDVKETLGVIFNKIKTLTSQKEIVLFLGCTHYGYIEDILLKESKKYDLQVNRIINPNVEFSMELLNATIPIEKEKIKKTPEVSIRIESQALIDPSEIKSIRDLIMSESPEIANLLENYTHLSKSF
ncbi:MAG: hypothetical protein H6627_04850 [Calditrichae bacterium]|nr:hypothetical protein [Calditrichota bacterium]MCB9057871.1 hypothetical protein [Calditrichia bacterium]